MEYKTIYEYRKGNCVSVAVPFTPQEKTRMRFFLITPFTETSIEYKTYVCI